MLRRTMAVLLLALLLGMCAGCTDRDPPRQVSLGKKQTGTAPAALQEGEVFRVAVGGMITPKEGFAYYRQFLDYLGARLGRQVLFIDRHSYAEINELIREEKVDLAFVCGGPYVTGHDEFGMELLVAPRAYGDTVYYSYIIVPAESQAQSFAELRGKRFAFTDPLSNTGKLVPTYMLARMGEDPDSFFSRYVYSGSHDKSIEAVARNLVDGAAVDSLIWEYARKSNPQLTERTRILHMSPPYGIPPVVVRAGLPAVLKAELRRIFLAAHQDEEGRAILAKMMIEEFVPIADNAYDSIREMISWVEEQAPPQAR
jgi:phosphonate transport system substrate-binding protein